MYFPPGKMLAHYRLDQKIDEGAMGVVYRAYNTRLECDVAVKVLPARSFEEPATRRRFRKEALALSKLNCARIAIVHDFDSQDDVDFLVMEFVPGVTLRDRLSAGPMPEREILDLGVQLAEGLEAAHQRGLVHCDIKPGNLRVTPDGQLKILDFGLVRHWHLASDQSSTESGSSSGTIAGTPAYMAPEQFDGKVDFRTDIYASGAVLYQMATGEAPFVEAESRRLLHAILHDAPVSPRLLNRALSAGFENIVLKCLEKEPRLRYQSARELWVDLERLRSPSARASSDRDEPPPRRSRWLPLLASLVVTAGIALILLRPGCNDDRRSEAVQMSVIAWPTLGSQSRISPDGKWASFVGDQGPRQALWVCKLSAGEPQALLTRSDIASHAWSPDGEEIAVLGLEGEGVLLQILPAFGGPPRKSATLKRPFMAARLVRWIGSNIYVHASFEGLWRFSVDTGEMREVLPANRKDPIQSLDVSADESRIAYVLQQGSQPVIWQSRLDGSDAKQMTPNRYSSFEPRWIGPGSTELVYSSDRSGETDLWRMSLGSGGSQRITFSSDAERASDASADGSVLIFSRKMDNAHLWIADARGREIRRSQLTSDTAQDSRPSSTGSGRLVAFQRSKPMLDPMLHLFGSQILLTQLQASTLEDIRVAVPEGGDATLSPDGAWLAFIKRSQSSSNELWLQQVSSGYAWQLAPQFSVPQLYASIVERVESKLAWAPDSHSLFWVGLDGTSHQSIYRCQPRPGSANSQRLVEGDSGVNLGDLRVSPDSRRLVYVGSTRRDATLFCRDLSDRESRTLLEHRAWPGHLLCPGWLGSSSAVLALRTRMNPDISERIEILEVDVAGTSRTLGVVDHAFGGSSRLDLKRRVLYLTKWDDGTSTANLYAFGLADGLLRRLTDNNAAKVSFSGLEVMADGRLLYSQLEQNEDIGVIRFAP